MTETLTASVDALRECVLDAGARGVALRVVGRGAWLDAGRGARTTESISTRELAGIIEYVPGDLTLTARAGTTLAEIREATAEHNQRLALDPHGTDDGTLGATVATASAGPLAASFGTPRDLTLGVEFVMGTGAVARGGGRVVKNVAGFDLTRLLTGSWGTLGILTEITVRLHARPEADESFAVSLERPGSAESVRRVLRRLPFTPYACEIVNDTFAAFLGIGHGETALLRLGGNAAAVRAQRTAFAELGVPREIDAAVWTRLRQAEPAGAIVFRMSHSASEIARTWTEANAVAVGCAGTLLHASPTRGVVRCIVPSSDGAAGWLRRAFGAPTMTTRIGERLPVDLWPMVSSAPASDPISSGIKRTFDPKSVLNAGILGEVQ
ncbi:MAG: linked oxidase protein [Gemmatimonadetes bacterium]|nr:linked oxidase protein [Gemmatimonadota bacterium]